MRQLTPPQTRYSGVAADRAAAKEPPCLAGGLTETARAPASRSRYHRPARRQRPFARPAIVMGSLRRRDALVSIPSRPVYSPQVSLVFRLCNEVLRMAWVAHVRNNLGRAFRKLTESTAANTDSAATALRESVRYPITDGLWSLHHRVSNDIRTGHSCCLTRECYRRSRVAAEAGRPRSPQRGPARDAQCLGERRSGARGRDL